jgi:hypothetical protein
MYFDRYWAQHKPIESYWHSTILVIFILFLIFGTLSNFVVILYFFGQVFFDYVLKFQNLKIHYRSQKIEPSNYLIINLMITDLFMIIPNFPMAAYNSFHGKWMFEQRGYYSLDFNESSLIFKK